MRPVDKKWPVSFGYGLLYPASLQHLTADHLHHGCDLATPIGTPVIAGVDGVLAEKGYLRGFGNCVYIKFWTGLVFRTTYRLILAHLAKITTTKGIGEKIHKLEKIGFTGDSGSALHHPHIHCECQKLEAGIWVPVNPEFVIGAG